jgi:hypothetical protein
MASFILSPAPALDIKKTISHNLTYGNVRKIMNWLNFRLQKRLDLSPNSIEAIYAMLAGIDGVKNSWHITKKILPQTIERLVRSVIITSTGSSNRIEGNNLTDLEVESL